MKALLKSKFTALMLLVLALCIALASCSPDEKCTSHRDADDNGKCDTEGCGRSFTDGCDTVDCLDTDGDGKCDNDGCNKETENAPAPCQHEDANDDGKCDECNESYTDGCDTADCLDTDGDGKCDNDGCDKETENTPATCQHRDANDDGKCDECNESYTDGCDMPHMDANDDGKCDFGGEAFFDGCTILPCLDTDGDGKCDNDGCDKPLPSNPVDGKITLTVTVKDESGNPVTGGKLQICKVGEACQKPVALDADGKASFTVLPGEYYASFYELPDGYEETDADGKYYFEDATDISVTLAAKSSTPTETEYKVSIVDADGNLMSDIIVTLKKDGEVKGASVAFGNAVSFTLPTDVYTVELTFNTGDQYHYEADECVLTPTENELTITLYLAPTEKEAVFAVPKDGSDHRQFNAFYLKEGSAYVSLTKNEMTYFLFRPERGGVYEFYADTSLELYTGYYGNPIAALAFNSGELDESGKKLILNIRDSSVGGEYLIGVRSDETTKVQCVFTINRVSDPIKSPEDEPYDNITSKLDLESITLGGEGLTVNITNIDITEKVTVVLGEDGYYHLGDANGPVIYVRVTTKSDYIDAFSTICNTSAFNAYFYDEDGNFVKKELYNDLILAYAAVADEATGLYPLTEEFATAIKNHGEYYGWWNATSGGFIFSGVAIDLDSAWLFACATVEITETNDNTEPDAPEVQKGYNVGNAAYTSEVALYNGEVYNTAQADGKILVINFWAAWCSPCKSELPDFDKVAAEYKDSITVLAVHLHDSRIDGEAYIAENFAETSILFGYDSVGDTFYYLLGGPDTIPMTLIIDENGIVANRFEAKISEATLKAAINAILAE